MSLRLLGLGPDEAIVQHARNWVGIIIKLLHCASTLSSFAITVNSLCMDTQCKDNLNVRTMPLVTNHCILTTVGFLNKDYSM